MKAIIIILVLGTVGLAAGVRMFPAVTRQRGGRILAFLSLFVLPVTIGALEGAFHYEQSKQTPFCLSCHVMSDFGKSLYRDDATFLPAAHFQNHRIPADEACYTCHTDYSMYGPIRAKLRGLRHVYVQYLGTVPKPAEIKLYEPYNNRECLHCHDGARSFEEAELHRADASTMPALKANEISCLSCHDSVHDVATIGKAKLWSPPKP